MKTFVVGSGAGRISLLEKLARKIEPSKEQLDAVKAPPKYSRVARVIKRATDIDGLIGPDPQEGNAIPTRCSIMMLDRKPMVFYTDGSLRHVGGRLKGKAARKVLKRMKHKIRNERKPV